MNKPFGQVFLVLVLLAILLSGCATASTPIAPTLTPLPPTDTPAPTATHTHTPTPTDTPIPPTPTVAPQPLLLRRSCGRDYIVKAGEPIQILYGAWALKGKEIADQWATNLTVNLKIDGQPISGEVNGPVPDLPYNCPKDYEDSYWLYFVANIPELSEGRHDITVTFNALRALPDGYGDTYGPGLLAEQTFRVTAQ